MAVRIKAWGEQYTGMACFGHALFSSGFTDFARATLMETGEVKVVADLIPNLHNQGILWYYRGPELCRRRIFSQPASGVAVFASFRSTPR